MLRALPCWLVLTCCSAPPVSSGTSTHDAATAKPADAGALHDASRAKHVDAGALQDASAGVLPACRWPSSVTPPIPDGGQASVYPSRAVVVCGSWVTDPTPTSSWEICYPDAGTTCGTAVRGPCLMGCKPDQYVLTTGLYSDEYDVPPPDADIVQVPLPAGCTGTVPGFSIGPSAEIPIFRCCACE